MRNRWIVILILLVSNQAFGQCKELFFSEYVEGYYNNKALEIYNPTLKTIHLNNYRITTWHNGVTSFVTWYSDTLTDSIGPNQAKVIVINKIDPKGSGLDTQVNEKLKVKADYFVSQNKYTCMSMNFNGDDPVTLERKTNGIWQAVDIIGKVGEKPYLASNPNAIIGWSDSFPFSTGKGIQYTKDHTIIRKRNVTFGVNTNPSYFNPKTEWLVYPVNMFDSLGTHICDCNKFPASVDLMQELQIGLYPNPAFEELTVYFERPFKEISILNLVGSEELNWKTPYASLSASFSLETLKPGLYVIKLTAENGEIVKQKFIKSHFR